MNVSISYVTSKAHAKRYTCACINKISYKIIYMLALLTLGLSIGIMFQVPFIILYGCHCMTMNVIQDV